MKIAMWSGPRNLSTAMMYAFGNRPDCAVSDEPFYAAYLAKTGRDHPMRGEILANHPTDPAEIAAHLNGPNPQSKPLWYQKHMCHHMADFPLEWALKCQNVFLIRHPVRVVASYAAKHENPTAQDIGFAAQAALYAQLGGIVINATDIRASPAAMLKALCHALIIPYDPAMLHWPKGGHTADGAWAAHWYGAVHASTGFAGAEGPLPRLSGPAEALARAAIPHYQALAANALKPL